VLCFDGRIANEYVTSEGTFKFERISQQFVAMFAGPVSAARELLEIYRNHLRGRVLDSGNALEELQIPVEQMKLRAADRFIGKRFGMGYHKFVSRKKYWPQEQFKRCTEAIEGHRTKLELILVGFINGFPALYFLSDDEVAVCHDMALIGVGAFAAETVLRTREQSENSTMGRTLYNVFEAKRAAEISSFVGRDTSMLILRSMDSDPNKYTGTVVMPDGFKFLQGLYGEYGPKELPAYIEFPERGLLEVPDELVKAP
jgi:hypothetical protein